MLILATAITISDAIRRFNLIARAIDEPKRLIIFARGTWSDFSGVPIFAQYPGLKIIILNDPGYVTALVDGKPVLIKACPVPNESTPADIVICLN